MKRQIETAKLRVSVTNCIDGIPYHVHCVRAAGMIFMCEFLENRCHAENDEWGRRMSLVEEHHRIARHRARIQQPTHARKHSLALMLALQAHVQLAGRKAVL